MKRGRAGRIPEDASFPPLTARATLPRMRHDAVLGNVILGRSAYSDCSAASAALILNTAGGSSPCARPCASSADHHARSSSITRHRDAGCRVDRHAGVVEGGLDLRNEDGLAQRNHLRLDRDRHEVLDRARSGRDASAVSDGGDGLVPQGEAHEDAVQRVLEDTRDRVQVLRGDHEHGVGFFDLLIPLPHDGFGIRGIAEVADRADVFLKQRERPVAEVEHLHVERAVRPRAARRPTGAPDRRPGSAASYRR